MSRRCVRTREQHESIWSYLSEDQFRHHLVSLEERTNAVPIAPQIFDASEWTSADEYSPQLLHTFPLDTETQLADQFASLAAVEEGAQSVAAVCVEEHLQEPKLRLRFAALDTSLNDAVRDTLQEISTILAQVSSESIEVTSKFLDSLFSTVVRLHYGRLLARLRSTKWEKPKYLSKSHKKPLWQDFKNLIHRVHFMYTKKERASRLVVESLLGEIETVYKNFDDVSEDVSGSIESLVVASFATVSSPQIKDYLLRLESSVNTLPTAQVASAIKSLKQIQKIAAYRRICLSLINIAREYPLMFRAGISMEYVVPFQSIPATIGYEEWATSCHVHAEVQLAVHYDLVFQENENPFLPPRVIGISKWLCYLCYHFLRAHGRLFPSKTHGRLYDQWTIPDLAEYDNYTVHRYQEIIRKIGVEVLRHISDEPELRRLEPMTSNDVYGN
jgi:hypothetical protein